MLVLNLITLITCITYESIVWFVVFISFWGFNGTIFHLFASMRAVHHERWRWWALVSLEIVNSINIPIFIIFWVMIAPVLIPALNWDAAGLNIIFHVIVIHTLPIIGSLLNTYYTDIKYVKSDKKYLVYTGLLYIIVYVISE